MLLLLMITFSSKGSLKPTLTGRGGIREIVVKYGLHNRDHNLTWNCSEMTRKLYSW